MKSASRFAVVLVTAPDLKTARALARAALRARLAACANLVPKMESHYWWQGRMESAAEVLVLFKTVKARLSALEKLILAQHHLGARFDFPLPPIVRFNFRNEVRASGETGAQRGAGQRAGGFQIGRGDKDHGEARRGFHGVKGCTGSAVAGPRFVSQPASQVSPSKITSAVTSSQRQSFCRLSSSAAWRCCFC